MCCRAARGSHGCLRAAAFSICAGIRPILCSSCFPRSAPICAGVRWRYWVRRPPGTGADAGRPWPFRWRQIWEFCFSSNIIIFLRRVRTVCWLRGASPPYRCWACSCLSASASTRFRRSVTLWTYTGAACPPSSAFGGICCLSPSFRSWWPGPLNAAAISCPNCSCLPVFPTSGPKAALC